jgi:hypothetical protein
MSTDKLFGSSFATDPNSPSVQHTIVFFSPICFFINFFSVKIRAPKMQRLKAAKLSLLDQILKKLILFFIQNNFKKQHTIVKQLILCKIWKILTSFECFVLFF